MKVKNEYHWLFLTKPFDLEGLVVGGTFKIFTARLGLSVRIFQIYFQKKGKFSLVFVFQGDTESAFIHI